MTREAPVLEVVVPLSPPAPVEVVVVEVEVELPVPIGSRPLGAQLIESGRSAAQARKEKQDR